MLSSNVTWGTLRMIHAEAVKNPELEISVDFLRDPDMAELSLTKLDHEYVYDHPRTDEDGDGESFYIVEDKGLGEVTGVLKIDADGGSMYRRVDEVWVPISANDVGPATARTKVEEGAAWIWDGLGHTRLTRFHFRPVLLEGF